MAVVCLTEGKLVMGKESCFRWVSEVQDGQSAAEAESLISLSSFLPASWAALITDTITASESAL
jgi:hypothetical protein